ncbi:hypothetical protein P879_03481 [Paragonimus westermani]|uniref:Uncharacterized protein n=1 Tax=Paragonimus westermani TaxID=34504 RepID=A0A8T0DMX6_9TREM|nr:hypothetical protein P879_03481 [Paragonimus westermani]
MCGAADTPSAYGVHGPSSEDRTSAVRYWPRTCQYGGGGGGGGYCPGNPMYGGKPHGHHGAKHGASMGSAMLQPGGGVYQPAWNDADTAWDDAGTTWDDAGPTRNDARTTRNDARTAWNDSWTAGSTISNGNATPIGNAWISSTILMIHTYTVPPNRVEISVTLERGYLRGIGGPSLINVELTLMISASSESSVRSLGMGCVRRLLRAHQLIMASS